MTNWAALDVAIGIVVVYILLSLLASTVNETISTALGWRSRFLEAWLRNVLVDPGERHDAEAKLRDFFDTPLLKPLTRQPRLLSTKRMKERRPSYIPSHLFAATLFSPGPIGEGRSASAALDAAIDGLPSQQLKDVVISLRQTLGDDVDEIRRRFERWYDDSMERVSGWYKRRIRVMLILIGLVVAITLNADTLQISRTLWSDKTVRAAVVAEADKVPAGGQGTGDLQSVADQVQQIKSLNIPLGWKLEAGDPRDLPHGARLWAAKVIGILITTLAVLLGAPFWFDLLSKIVKLRGSGGTPPKEAAPSGAAASR
jgi:hypothetical protein